MPAKATEAAKTAGTASQTAEEKMEARLAVLEKERQADQAALATEREARRGLQFASTVRKAAKQAGVVDVALDDAAIHLRHSRGMQLGAGGVVATEDGGTTLADALKAMRTETPYYFAASEGGGSTAGGRRSTSAAKKVDSILGNEDEIIAGEAEWTGKEAN